MAGRGRGAIAGGGSGGGSSGSGSGAPHCRRALPLRGSRGMPAVVARHDTRKSAFNSAERRRARTQQPLPADHAGDGGANDSSSPRRRGGFAAASTAAARPSQQQRQQQRQHRQRQAPVALQYAEDLSLCARGALSLQAALALTTASPGLMRLPPPRLAERMAAHARALGLPLADVADLLARNGQLADLLPYK